MFFFEMPDLECPKLVRGFCGGFKDLVPKKGDYRSHVALVCRAVFSSANLSEVSKICDFLGSEELPNEYNPKQRLPAKFLLEKVKTNPERYQFAIDDTLVTHSGKDMWWSLKLV